MVDQNSQFYAILTNVGAAKQANADALGVAWKITHMGVGDANGTDPLPNASQVSLLNEWRRAPLNQLKVDDKNPAIIVAEQVIPADVGGRWIREIGLYDDAGDLVALANCAPTYKPMLSQGAGRTQVVRMNLVVSSASNVQLKIDPSVVLATREWVTEELARQDFKYSVLVATTAPITLSGLQTIDGVALAAGSRVLVKDQATAKDNGIYQVIASGLWTRSPDADASAKVTAGLLLLVERGTLNADSAWQLVTDGPIALGVTALTFEMAFGRSGVAAGTYRSVQVDKYGRVLAASNPTTVAGYGLTDVYTKLQTDSALALKAPLSSPALTGTPTAPTPALTSTDATLATTQFVHGLLSVLGLGGVGTGAVISDLDDPTVISGFYYVNNSSANQPYAGAGGMVLHKVYGGGGFQMLSTLAASRVLWRRRTAGAWQKWEEFANLDSPNFAGSPTAPTALKGTSSKQLATTEFVQLALNGLVDSAPSTLDTLKELAAALANDPNFATTITNQLAGKAALSHTHGIADILGLTAALNAASGLNQGSTTQDPNEASSPLILAKHANAPDPTNFWYITTTFYSSINAASNRGQLAIQYSSGVSAYVRNCVNGTWSSWVRMDNGVEPGTIVHFAGSTPPRGFLKANGAAVNRNTYSALFAQIGTTHGEGNGSTTFNLPDLRGEFLRGLADGRLVDAGRLLGTWQDSKNLSHTHSASASQETHSHTVTGNTSSDGAHTHPVVSNGGQYASEAQPYGVYRGNGATSVDRTSIQSGGAHQHAVTGTTNTASHTHTITLTPEGGEESRPRNVALLACIKY
nr:phage tail protein [Pseudomonas sp. EZ-C24]